MDIMQSAPSKSGENVWHVWKPHAIPTKAQEHILSPQFEAKHQFELSGENRIFSWVGPLRFQSIFLWLLRTVPFHPSFFLWSCWFFFSKKKHRSAMWVCLWTHLETWFLGNSCNFEQLCFWKKKSPEICFHSQIFFSLFLLWHFWMFHARKARHNAAKHSCLIHDKNWLRKISSFLARIDIFSSFANLYVHIPGR